MTYYLVGLLQLAGYCTLLIMLLEILGFTHVYGILSQRRRRLPKGPTGLPIIGNLREWLRVRQSPGTLLAFVTAQAKYGEMSTLTLGSKTWVLLNSPRVVNEIIQKRSSVTHQRPPMPIADDLISRGKRSVLQQTEDWVEGRRVRNWLFKSSTLERFGTWQEAESVRMLDNYLRRPEEWFAHHTRYSNSIMHRMILGESLDKDTAEIDDLQRVTIEFLSNINARFVDFYPRLANLPKKLQFWRARWEKVGEDHYRVFRVWWTRLKQAHAHGNAPPGFVRDALLAKEMQYTGSDEDAMYLAMSTIAAGTDNTRIPINTFVMAALLHPNEFTKAREEADKICGHKAERLPKITDMPQMPYTCALVKEVLRWRPGVVLVPNHQLTHDLEFEGYFFRAGTEFVVNSFPVAHSLGGPNSFQPERWMDGNEMRIAQGLWVFGGGKRLCVGYKLAQTQLFIAFASLLYCFNYSPAGDLDDMDLGHSKRGEPFPASVSVRSKEHERLIAREKNAPR